MDAFGIGIDLRVRELIALPDFFQFQITVLPALSLFSHLSGTRHSRRKRCEQRKHREHGQRVTPQSSLQRKQIAIQTKISGNEIDHVTRRLSRIVSRADPPNGGASTEEKRKAHE